MTILDEIFEAKRLRVDEAKRATDAARLFEAAQEMRLKLPAHRFRSALESRDRLNIIAEFKRASPSEGVINDSLDPAEMALVYESGGACAVSVLTESDFFNGSIDDLRRVRGAVSLPILRKDFILDEFQVYESAALGADAILLIVAALDIADLKDLQRVGRDELGLDVLVEVHTRAEMDIANEIGATLIGVNNRDLQSFDVSVDVSRQLAKYAPSGTALVSESGLRTRDELLELNSLGYSGFLIGEMLMRNDDPQNELRRLVNGNKRFSEPSAGGIFL